MANIILSFDCANRSLAVCGFSDNKIIFMKVYDLTEGKTCSTIERARLLKTCLSSIEITPSLVLVEYQMSANDKSRCISQQIVYHYIDICEVVLVGPSLKNKICLSADGSLEHATFMEKYSSKYTANKNHTKANFLYWLASNNCSCLIADNKIKKKNIDDIADAFMQILGYFNQSSQTSGQRDEKQ